MNATTRNQLILTLGFSGALAVAMLGGVAAR